MEAERGWGGEWAEGDRGVGADEEYVGGYDGVGGDGVYGAGGGGDGGGGAGRLMSWQEVGWWNEGALWGVMRFLWRCKLLWLMCRGCDDFYAVTMFGERM